jgi:hypothetical protein
MSQDLEIYRGDENYLYIFLETRKLLSGDFDDPFAGSIEVRLSRTEDKESATDVQIKTFQYLAENLEAILISLSEAIYEEREDYQEVFGTYEGGDWGFPNLKKATDVLEYISIDDLIINYDYDESDVKEGMTYFSFQGECQWEHEHGFGASMFKTEVLDFCDNPVRSPGRFKEADFRRKTVAEKYGLRYSNVIEPPARIIKLSKEEEQQAHLKLFDWLIDQRAIKGYRSTPVNLTDQEKIQLIYSIKSLTLIGKDLETLPEEFRYLKHLDRLNLRGNSFKTVPNSITYLKRLTSLDLSLNSLSDLPSRFSYLERLHSLDLSQNHFRSYPKTLTRMSWIQNLNLKDNYIGLFARWIGNFKRTVLYR